ncbi:MAG TPA: hypothetical protein EYG91_05465 [Aquifex aeolicus]|nr:hypothetical protein [Aquifex aeolicus]
MKHLIGLIIPLIIISCQDIPEKYKTPEGQKILEKYKKQYIKGLVLLDEKIQEKVPEGEKFLIISVRKPEQARPVAVLRVKNPIFPFKFKITGKHKINPEEFIEGELIVTARLSKEPTAGFKNGDLFGITQTKAGEENVKILINQVFEEKKE